MHKLALKILIKERQGLQIPAGGIAAGGNKKDKKD